MDPLYLIRLDDACPTNNLKKWNYIEDLLDKFGIKPIVAVIPDNKDKELLSRSTFDNNFWDRVHRWIDKGWIIAQHGCTHEYLTKKKGIVPLNSYSEFAGVPIEIQREKIKKGFNILASNGVEPKVWVAPAHTFDKNTLKVLRCETDIRIISDGLSIYPYNYAGFLWIPQQLWSFHHKNEGVWTICLHPETLENREIDHLSKSIAKNLNLFNNNFFDLIKYQERKRNIKDILFQQHFFLQRKYDRLYTTNFSFRKLAEMIKLTIPKPAKKKASLF